jgi:hypothetical protein
VLFLFFFCCSFGRFWTIEKWKKKNRMARRYTWWSGRTTTARSIPGSPSKT